jgi:hypothetical protein
MLLGRRIELVAAYLDDERNYAFGWVTTYLRPGSCHNLVVNRLICTNKLYAHRAAGDNEGIPRG